MTKKKVIISIAKAVLVLAFLAYISSFVQFNASKDAQTTKQAELRALERNMDVLLAYNASDLEMTEASRIYKATLDPGIEVREKFQQWLKQHGIKGLLSHLGRLYLMFLPWFGGFFFLLYIEKKGAKKQFFVNPSSLVFGILLYPLTTICLINEAEITIRIRDKIFMLLAHCSTHAFKKYVQNMTWQISIFIPGKQQFYVDYTNNYSEGFIMEIDHVPDTATC